ncbi:MAG: DUF368 domain-containing protein [Pseudomonadales bacterium]|jgi:putative membrane protein
MEEASTTGSKQRRISLFFKGMGMGAADVVPGVSGGTVAFITGIYEELIDSLTAFNVQAFKLLIKGRIKALWQHVNATFLLVLFAGILTSIFSLTRFISWALGNHPKIVWGYFFGLILASVIAIGRQLDFKRWSTVIMFALAAWVAFEITRLTSVSTSPTLLFVFFSGAIAICAMILPGISGSFILLLLGMYQHIIDAVHSFNGVLLGTFALGCVCGLISFTHLLSWLLHRFHRATLAALTGFMLGSLNKVWPWKQALGENGVVLERNLWPTQYQGLTQTDPQVAAVLLALGLGLLTVFLINRANYAKPMA